MFYAMAFPCTILFMSMARVQLLPQTSLGLSQEYRILGLP